AVTKSSNAHHYCYLSILTFHRIVHLSTPRRSKAHNYSRCRQSWHLTVISQEHQDFQHCEKGLVAVFTSHHIHTTPLPTEIWLARGHKG
ncbi:unnamed protein product, partial [Ixodes pacificus]